MTLKIKNNLTQKEYKHFLLLLIGIFSIFPTILGTIIKNTESFLYYNRFVWLLVIYCIAGYLYKYDLDIFSNKLTQKYKKSVLWFWVHIITWAVIIIYIMVLERYPNIFRLFLGDWCLLDSIYFWRPKTVLMLILSTSLFMTFKNMKFHACSKLTLFLSSSTFGIYMLHGGRSGSFWWNRIFHNSNYEGTWFVFIDAFAALCIIFIVGITIEFLRQRIAKLISHFYHITRIHK